MGEFGFSSAVLDAENGARVVGPAGEAGVMRLLGFTAGRALHDRSQGELLVGASLVPSRTGNLGFWMCHERTPS